MNLRISRLSWFGVVVGLLAVIGGVRAADWQGRLMPEGGGPCPEVRAFRAEYRFGWSEIDAARASVEVNYKGDEVQMRAHGGTFGLARFFYSLDVSHLSRCKRHTYLPVDVHQVEKYSKEVVTTRMVSKPDGLWVLRESDHPGPTPAKWKHVKIWPVRDLVSGMFFIRSQRLAKGDDVCVVIYPDSSPFLVEMRVLGTETLAVCGVQRDTLKLDLRIQKINLKNGGTLENHSKFQSGTVWLSNDADRIPLRAEVQIFIGYVFGEILSCQFSPPKPTSAHELE